MQQSHIKCLVTWKQVKRDRLSNILWNLDIKFVSSYQIPCDECICMHAVLFTVYVVKKLYKCMYKLCSVLSECPILRNAEGMKMKSDDGDFHSNLNTLVNFGCNKPQKQKKYVTFRPTWSNYSRIVMLCIHILACSYQWNKYSYQLKVNVLCVLILCTHNIYFCINYKSESM